MDDGGEGNDAYVDLFGGSPRSSRRCNAQIRDRGTAGGEVLRHNSYQFATSDASAGPEKIYCSLTVTVTWCLNVPLTPMKCKESVPVGSLVDVLTITVSDPATVADGIHNQIRADRWLP
jgi:hypothetical protein